MRRRLPLGAILLLPASSRRLRRRLRQRRRRRCWSRPDGRNLGDHVTVELRGAGRLGRVRDRDPHGDGQPDAGRARAAEPDDGLAARPHPQGQLWARVGPAAAPRAAEREQRAGPRRSWNVPLSELTAGGLAINVHQSNADLDTWVACGTSPAPPTARPPRAAAVQPCGPPEGAGDRTSLGAGY